MVAAPTDQPGAVGASARRWAARQAVRSHATPHSTKDWCLCVVPPWDTTFHCPSCLEKLLLTKVCVCVKGIPQAGRLRALTALSWRGCP